MDRLPNDNVIAICQPFYNTYGKRMTCFSTRIV